MTIHKGSHEAFLAVLPWKLELRGTHFVGLQSQACSSKPALNPAGISLLVAAFGFVQYSGSKAPVFQSSKKKNMRFNMVQLQSLHQRQFTAACKQPDDKRNVLRHEAT